MGPLLSLALLPLAEQEQRLFPVELDLPEVRGARFRGHGEDGEVRAE